MVRVGVQASSEIDAQFGEDTPTCPPVHPGTPLSFRRVPPVPPTLERRQSKSNPSSHSGSNVRNAAEIWKGQLTKRLAKHTDLLLNPPQQEDVPVATPQMIRTMPLCVRIRFFLNRPEESKVGWCIHHFILVAVALNVCVMAMQTLDGPRFVQGSDPAYPYLPKEALFEGAEALFSVVYFLEFAARWLTASSQRKYWKSKQTWLGLLALLPVFFFTGAKTMDGNESDPKKLLERIGTSLQFTRILRLPIMSRVHVGSKVMFEATLNSLAPLRITLFFLIAVVMLFATGVFFAEPCYDLQECTFTDIFNAGYFVMVTVATVGYGSQVPSLRNGGSLVLTCVVMIFGQLYLSMPLAIIGMNYNLAWKKHDDRMKQLAITKLAKLDAAMSLSRANHHVKQPSRRSTYSELQPTQTCTVSVQSHQIFSQFCELSQKTAEINAAVQRLIQRLALEIPVSPAPSAASKTLSKSVQDSMFRILDNLATMLKLHNSLVTKLRFSLSQLVRTETMKANAARSPAVTGSIADDKLPRRSNSIVVDMFGRAARALRSDYQVNYVKKQYYHSDPPIFRSVVWNIFEHNDFSRFAFVVNRIRMLVVIASIILFYLQTTPELQKTGVDTILCKRALADFCRAHNQPGCYVVDSEGNITATRLDFDCSSLGSEGSFPTCYGEGNNYGSESFSQTCSEAFGDEGLRRVCNNRLCETGADLIAGMEPQWIYMEFALGMFFTLEMLLRAYSHPLPQKLWEDPTLMVDLIALFPFYVEVGEIISGLDPVYSVVPIEPTFFAGVRVVKVIRVLKLGTHIPGARVLTRTVLLVYQRLTIPVVWSLAPSSTSWSAGSCVLSAKNACGGGKNVLTPVLAEGLPEGKRVLIQNTQPSILTDMIRSTWLALVTFTTVGYGDMKPRMSFGRLFDIFGMVFSACYTAMPLSLVGGQFYICYEAFVMEEKKRRVKEPQQPEQHVATSKAQIVPVDKSLEVAVPKPSSSAPPNDNWELKSVPSSPPSITDPTSSLQSAQPAAVSTTRLSVSIDLVPNGLQLSTLDTKLLQAFVLIQQVITEVTGDLSKLNLHASRRISLRRSSTEAVNKAEIEQKISNNLFFIEMVLLKSAPVIERIQKL